MFDPLLIEQFESNGYVQIPMGIFLDRVPHATLDGSAFADGSKALEEAMTFSFPANVDEPTIVKQMDPLSGWWSKLSTEMLILQNIIDLVEVGSLHLKAALDWKGKCIQGGADSSNYTNLLKYYCGCRLQLREGLLNSSSNWKKTKTPTQTKLYAELKKPKDVSWKQYALQIRDVLTTE